jgi:hypothetical protein
MREKLLNGYTAMRGNISRETEKTIEKISKYINKNLKTYSRTKFIDGMYDLMLELLIEVYSITSKMIRDLYDGLEIERLSDEEIMKLTYSADGKELRERIEEHYDNVMKRIESERKDYFLHRMMLIVNTESLTVSNGILHKKLAKYAVYAEVTNSDDDICWEHEECEYWLRKGKIPVDELTELPPYHPDCECMVVYYL